MAVQSIGFRVSKEDIATTVDIINQIKIDAPTLEKLKDRVLADIVEINDVNLASENINNISKTHRYSTLLMTAEEECKKLKLLMRRLKSQLRIFLRINSERLLSERDIDAAIEKYGPYMRLQNAIDQQESLVAFLERTVKLFQQRSFAIRNAIDMKKHDLI